MGILDTTNVDHSLRPMRYPDLYEHYKQALKDHWTVQELDFSRDLAQLEEMSEAERHMLNRIVAFFASGDSIVAGNVITIYQGLNNPEARMYLCLQAAQEALHMDAYLLLLDSYVPDPEERAAAFKAIESVPSIRRKAEFCANYMPDGFGSLSGEDFVKNITTFACAVEGLFFFAAFAYVFYLRSQGKLDGLAAANTWIARDEGQHMEFAFKILDIVREENPELYPTREWLVEMLTEAVDCEFQFAQDALQLDVVGLKADDMKEYLRFCADTRLKRLGYAPEWNAKNPFPFMVMQDLQELTNFFEKKVTAYQVGIEGEVAFDEDF